MRSKEAAYAERLHRWQQTAIEKIHRAVALDGSRVLTSGLNLYGAIPELRNDLLNIRSGISNFGRGQVNEELKRQKR